MRIGAARMRVEWGHLALVAVIAAFCLWYWQDARAASGDFQNLLLIEPAAIFALALCAVIVAGAIELEPAAEEPGPAAEEPGPAAQEPGPAAQELEAAAAPPRAFEWRGILVALLLVAYVLVVIPAGFDAATGVFLAAAMYVLGERRPLFLLGYSAVLALALSYGFKVMLSVPVPTLLF